MTLRSLFPAPALFLFALCAQAAPSPAAPGSAGPGPTAVTSTASQSSLPTLVGRSTDWKPEYTGDFDHFGVDTKRNKLLLAAEDHGTKIGHALDAARPHLSSRVAGR